MKMILLLLVIFSFSVYSQTTNGNSAHFNDWKARHGRNYKSTDEEERRQQNFNHRNSEIDRLNSLGGATFGHNRFSDWSDDEFSSFQGGKPSPSYSKREVSSTSYDVAIPNPLPTVNWCDSNNNKCTAIKDQGSCGSCWAYSTTTAYESAVAIKNGFSGSQIPVYSPQYVLDCNTNPSVTASSRACTNGCWQGSGCGGGPISYGYLVGEGHFLLSDYPYSSDLNAQTCQKTATATPDNTLINWVNAQSATEKQICANVAAYGPIPALVYAGTAWQSYSGGIVTASQCGSAAVNHAVVIVGCTPTNWIIRNSWGSDWGESGFIRIEMGTGACSISNYAYLVPNNFINPSGPTAPTTPTTPTAPKAPVAPTTPTTPTAPKAPTTPTAPKTPTTPTAPKAPTTPTTPKAPTTPTAPTAPTAGACKSSYCMPWPVTVGSITMTQCSNLPCYGVPTSPTGICIMGIKGNSFNYTNCPSSCGTTNVPSYTSASRGGSDPSIIGMQAAVSDQTATSSSGSSPVSIYVGASVAVVVVVVAIVIIVVLIKRRRADREEIV
jgi:cathepsin L